MLTPKALRDMVWDKVQRLATLALLAGAAKGSRAKGRPLSMKAIQAEVDAFRRARRVGNFDSG